MSQDGYTQQDNQTGFPDPHFLIKAGRSLDGLMFADAAVVFPECGMCLE